MVRVKDYYQATTKKNAWSISNAIKVELSVGYIVMVPGTYPISGRMEVGGVSYDVINANAHPLELTTLSPSPTVMPFILLVDHDGKISRFASPYGTSSAVSTEPADFRAEQTVETKVDTNKGYTNFELIYTGISGGVLRVTYREYSPDDLARTAFFQDLTYNVDQKNIRFRDMSIELAKATNELVSFKVLNMPSEYSDRSNGGGH